ncbi:porin family protein [Dysgonomonas sp. PH5-45]|uniref:type IX secretion/gliding motility protein PorT/SprT n=1 Tax=Dysgonomonas sp. PH5-45 TaxID=1742396 RepID=UPI0032AEE00C
MFCLLFAGQASAQSRQAMKNRPYADQRMLHLGFTVGVHWQDLILSHSGVAGATGEVWHAEIPSYSPGFSAGIIVDRYINHFMNLRFIPSLYFGGKEFVFKEQATGQEFKTTEKTNYLSLPIHMKFSSERNNNMRPYIFAGGFLSTEIGTKKNSMVSMSKYDYGIEIGIGCDFYLPLCKFCPELRFSFGLADMIDKKGVKATELDKKKYTEAFSSAKSRMITLTFNFE